MRSSSCPDDAQDATQYRLWDMLGKAHGSSGRLDEAIAAYESGPRVREDRLSRATVEDGIGEAYHRKGRFDDAIRHFDVALREAGYPRPRSSPGMLLDMGKTAVYFHMLPSWFHLPGGGPDRDRRVEIALATYYRLAQSSRA